MTNKPEDFIIDINLESDGPLPDNIEDITKTVIEIACVAVIARGELHNNEDIEAIIEAVYAYTDSKAFDRALVAQIIQQYFSALLEDEQENENGD